MLIKLSKPGIIVRDPLTMSIVPDCGVDVEMSSFWLRRIKDGDIVEVKATSPAKKVK